jgi:hypothetical protein
MLLVTYDFGGGPEGPPFRRKFKLTSLSIRPKQVNRFLVESDLCVFSGEVTMATRYVRQLMSDQ